MRPYRVSLSAVGPSTVFPLDSRRNPFNVSLQSNLGAGDTATFGWQFTLDDVFAVGYDPLGPLANWFEVPNYPAGSAGGIAYLNAPATAVRCDVTALTGALGVVVLQAGDGP